MDKQELYESLQACLHIADRSGLAMIGIHISHAIELLAKEDILR